MNFLSAKTPRHLYIKRNGKRLFHLFLVIIGFVLGIFYCWKYYFTYREGYRAGFLKKLARKGTIFITHEFEMVLGGVTGITDIAIASRKFFFSVTNKNLARQLDTTQGQKVMVRYRHKKGVFFRKGEAEYLVLGAEIIQ